MPKSLLEKSEAIRKIVFFFFSYPKKQISLNDLVDEVKISKTTANKAVRILEKDGFLKKEVIGKTWRISCDNNHSYNATLKIAYNLWNIYESNLIQKIHSLIRSPSSIILFGSYRKGDDIEESDLDIAVEVLDNKELKICNLGKINIGYRKNVQVNMHIFSRNKIDINLFANISNGIVLEGFLEVKP